jgi:glycosyltransferase involved in cell wall biosynthesis
MENKISVIIPVFNAEKYLAECIDSILKQKSLYEIILINDGSKDNSSVICNKYQNQYPSIIKYKEIENHGASYARNIGIELATGEYILFVDSDDSLVDNTFSILLSIIETTHCDIILWGLTKHYYNGGSVAYSPRLNSGIEVQTIEKIILDLKVNCENFYYFGFICNKLYKRNIIEAYNIRFRDTLNIGEDEVFAMEYCTHIHSIYVLDKSLYNYRILSSSLTFRRKKLSEYIMIAEQILQFKECWESQELQSFDSIRAFQFALRGYFENSPISIFTNQNLKHILLNTQIESSNPSYFQYKGSFSRHILKTKNRIARIILLLTSHIIVNLKR